MKEGSKKRETPLDYEAFGGMLTAEEIELKSKLSKEEEEEEDD